MNPLMLTILTQIMVFCAGSILLIYAGKQDEKTRNPLLLIPALMLIGLSAGTTTFLIISLASLIIFLLPEKVNKVIGKADLLLFYSLLTIIILNQNILLSLILYISLAITFILLLTNKNKEKQVPLISYYAQRYSLTIIITIGVAIGVLIKGLL